MPKLEKHKSCKINNPYWRDYSFARNQIEWSIPLRGLVKSKNWLPDKKCDKIITPSDKLAECFGAFYGDGCVKNVLEFKCYDDSVNKRISELMYEITGTKPWVGRDKWGDYLKYGIIIARLFSYIGLPKNKSYSDELLPIWIIKGNTEIKKSFIRGYFSTDGYCGWYSRNGKKLMPRIHLTFNRHKPLARKNLTEQLISILRDLNIEAKFYNLKRRGGIETLICIFGRNVLDFYKIGFISEEKQRVLEEICRIYKPRLWRTKSQILKIYQEKPLFAKEIANILGIHPTSIRRHLCELRERGFIKKVKYEKDETREKILSILEKHKRPLKTKEISILLRREQSNIFRQLCKLEKLKLVKRVNNKKTPILWGLTKWKTSQ